MHMSRIHLSISVNVPLVILYIFIHIISVFSFFVSVFRVFLSIYTYINIFCFKISVMISIPFRIRNEYFPQRYVMYGFNQ